MIKTGLISCCLITGQIFIACSDGNRGFQNSMNDYMTPCYSNFVPLIDDADFGFGMASYEPCDITSSEVLPLMRARFSELNVDEQTSSVLRLSKTLTYNNNPSGQLKLCFGLSQSGKVIILRAGIEGETEDKYFRESVFPEFLAILEK